MLWSDGLGSIAAAAGRHIGAGAAIREAGLFMVRGRTVSFDPKKNSQTIEFPTKFPLKEVLGVNGVLGPARARMLASIWSP